MPSQAIHYRRSTTRRREGERSKKKVCDEWEKIRKLCCGTFSIVVKRSANNSWQMELFSKMISHLSPHTHTHRTLLKNDGNICCCVTLCRCFIWWYLMPCCDAYFSFTLVRSLIRKRERGLHILFKSGTKTQHHTTRTINSTVYQIFNNNFMERFFFWLSNWRILTENLNFLLPSHLMSWPHFE